MRKSIVRATILCSRESRLAVTVAIAVLGGWSAQAATLTETFTFDPLDGYGFETGSDFSAFDPALGTLNSVTYDVVATANFTGGGPSDFNDAAYELTFVGVDSSETPVLTNQTMAAVSFGNGAAQASLTSTDSSLATYLVPGAVTPNLTIVNATNTPASISSTFATESVTYNYTPATPVPEPPSIGLLAIGLVGLGWRLRHRPLMALPAHC
jgi:hypothetical protein